MARLCSFGRLVPTGPGSSVLDDEGCAADVWLSMTGDPNPPALEFSYMRELWDFRTPDKLEWKPMPPLPPIVLKKDRGYRRFWKLS